MVDAPGWWNFKKITFWFQQKIIKNKKKKRKWKEYWENIHENERNIGICSQFTNLCRKIVDEFREEVIKEILMLKNLYFWNH